MDYKEVLNAWEQIGKTPNGKIVIDDLVTDLCARQDSTKADAIGYHNALSDLLIMMRGNKNE